MVDEIIRQLEAHKEILNLVQEKLIEPISECIQILADALRKGHKVLVMGNGGSAADAQHLAAELVGRFLLERKALPAIALTTDSSILTSISNDYGFDEVFKRQVDALAAPGDVLIGISTSGHSQNVKLASKPDKESAPGPSGCLVAMAERSVPWSI